MRTKTIKTESGDVVVTKLPLGKYADLLRAVKTLPNELIKLWQGSEQKLDMAVLLPQLPVLMADTWPDFIGILAIATDKDAEWLSENVDLAEGAEIFAAAIELNDYQKVIATVKKIMAVKSQVETAPEKSA